jgi:DNA-binding NarL/FixJ family response regulator
MPAIPFTDRTCTRCGRGFPQFERERVCPICRKPKIRGALESWPERVGRRLSFREQQIAELIAQAQSNPQIAYELKLATGTIKEYLHRMMAVALRGKLLQANRVALAVWWITEGRAEYAVQSSANPSEVA